MYIILTSSKESRWNEGVPESESGGRELVQKGSVHIGVVASVLTNLLHSFNS